MTDKQLYQSGIDFLLSFEGISRDILALHLKSEYEKPKDIKIIYLKLCESAQNKQMSSRVIGSSIGGIDKLRKILFDFNPTLVSQAYKKNDCHLLLSKIKEELNPCGQVRTTNRSLWPQFCQSVIDSAYFLRSFDTAESFYEWANLFANDTKAKAALPLMISIEITGIGFPLACDFLKELGFSGYGKPDVHVKDIFKALGIIDPIERSPIKQDYATLKAISRIADANGVTSYAVDKVFWLIGSGNFYLSGKNTGRQKQNYINRILKGVENERYL